MVEPTASGRGSCALTVALAGIVVIGGVIWLLVGVWRVSQDVPIREALTFTACGQPYDLRPGYSAFDYGSRANAEVPVGQTIYNVRSTEPGIPPPDSAGDIFEAWPAEISNLVLGDPY
ncbi:MAG: hypothetical protein GY701_32610, partial [Sulfitobacter sp.]|nr:hypothetical protein [Sulfitobacter sp.]